MWSKTKNLNQPIMCLIRCQIGEPQQGTENGTAWAGFGSLGALKWHHQYLSSIMAHLHLLSATVCCTPTRDWRFKVVFNHSSKIVAWASLSLLYKCLVNLLCVLPGFCCTHVHGMPRQGLPEALLHTTWVCRETWDCFSGACLSLWTVEYDWAEKEKTRYMAMKGGGSLSQAYEYTRKKNCARGRSKGSAEGELCLD